MPIAATIRDIRHLVLGLLALAGLMLASQSAFAAAPDVAAPETAAEASGEAAADGEAATDKAAADAEGSYEHLGPEWIKGQPTSFEDDPWKSTQFQDQYTDNGNYAKWMNTYILTPVIVVISAFVFFLLLVVVVRYRRREGREPSRTTHNTLVEVVWTIVPVLILIAIAVPSITLLARQYETPPADAITIKATGYQWYWGYTYPDQGGFEVISNMLPEEEALSRGLPGQLAVDNRMVVPVGVPLRIQTFGADVIHSFAVPSLWFKLDAIPGRLNERLLTIDEPGIYYGQCSELCGARHAYMPIAIEAVPMDRWRQWVLSKGGSFGEDAETSEAMDIQAPASAADGAPAAGGAPTAADDGGTAPSAPLDASEADGAQSTN
ncbi:cytochrome c oxidase subunit II [Alteriqipengyuania lutimaris]|uniref:Cytochrome c oxidase subunit 2 n=1 Tax=Alteriqipengyuania lutimaris TaxID=1538146 RepID=A0A395LLK9_9SPHN|nr:cytochrome c oxidase subunit II [Alteriqipengyuania lutimaris]MBB3033201.1 cytochrome c oxidase subunit 2 [Alteriqipengyuania lutimaris]RDS77751.1 cytochrome c oxidase subunit II [Alteriqipengyuania lutimaris]